jgi:IS5 family transposase
MPESGSSPEKVAPKLFPEETFPLRVRRIADELFTEDRWVDLYSDVGRPARDPKVMTIALILQQHRNLSDRQMSEATRYDLNVKAALGLAWDDPGIAKTSFSEFRARLLEYGRECEAFNLLNQKLVEKKAIRKKEALYVDASHLEASASTPNPPTLIRKATQQILRQLKKERPELYRKLSEKVPTNEAVPSSNRDYYLLPRAEKVERFGEAAGMARTVIAELERKKLSPALKAKLELLDVILEERATDDDEPIDPDDAPPDRTANHRDTDARWGAKGKDKFFFGYKRTIVTNKDGFVVTFGVDPGNTPDGVVLDVLVDDAQELFDVQPEKVVGDAAYGSVTNHRKMKDKGVQLVTSLKPAPNPKGMFSRDRFTYAPETRTLTCPSGATTQESFASQDGEGQVFRFQAHQCGSCKLRFECTSGDYRSVKVKETIPDLQDAFAYGKTSDYRQDMKDRQVMEGKHSELIRYHGGRRTRYTSLDRVFAGEAMRCLVVNLKRLFKLERMGLIPVMG